LHGAIDDAELLKVFSYPVRKDRRPDRDGIDLLIGPFKKDPEILSEFLGPIIDPFLETPVTAFCNASRMAPSLARARSEPTTAAIPSVSKTWVIPFSSPSEPGGHRSMTASRKVRHTGIV
jgi:hypothetical protein